MTGQRMAQKEEGYLLLRGLQRGEIRQSEGLFHSAAAVHCNFSCDCNAASRLLRWKGRVLAVRAPAAIFQITRNAGGRLQQNIFSPHHHHFVQRPNKQGETKDSPYSPSACLSWSLDARNVSPSVMAQTCSASQTQLPGLPEADFAGPYQHLADMCILESHKSLSKQNI